MGEIEFSWTKYNPKLIPLPIPDKVYELTNFGKTKPLDKKVLVLVHQGTFEDYLHIQLRQFEKLGVLRAWGWDSNTNTHYIVIEKIGEFLESKPTVDQQKLLTKAQEKYKKEYGMELRIKYVWL
jgi:hypothetical protein